MDKISNTHRSPKEELKATKTLVIALVVQVAFFALISIFLFKELNAPLKLEGQLMRRNFFLLSVLIAIVCLAAAFNLYKKGIMALKNPSLLLEDKLIKYRVTLIKFIALCEGAAMFSVVIFFLTGLYETFFVTVILVLAMLSKFPIAKKLADELNLDWNERNELT